MEEADKCLFCRFAKGIIPVERVYDDADVMAFRDINPQASTHILIIPKRHIATLNELGSEHAELVGRMQLAATELAKDHGLAERGYRTVMNCNADAGQTVFHIHLHLLGGREFSWPPG